jgi:hypothetical protein
VEFYGGKKGLVVINESTSKDFELIVKKFLMKAAHFIFKKEEGRWPDLKPGGTSSGMPARRVALATRFPILSSRQMFYSLSTSSGCSRASLGMTSTGSNRTRAFLTSAA